VCYFCLVCNVLALECSLEGNESWFCLFCCLVDGIDYWIFRVGFGLHLWG